MSIDAMKQALELCERMRDGREPWGRDELRKICIDLRAAIEQAQEPAGWLLNGNFYAVKQCRLFSNPPGEEIPGQIPLYTAPRQWQGLTRQEFLDATQGLEDLEDCWMAIEAKLKEKNT